MLLKDTVKKRKDKLLEPGRKYHQVTYLTRALNLEDITLSKLNIKKTNYSVKMDQKTSKDFYQREYVEEQYMLIDF